jgi:hypothetical protein
MFAVLLPPGVNPVAVKYIYIITNFLVVSNDTANQSVSCAGFNGISGKIFYFNCRYVGLETLNVKLYNKYIS